MRGAVLPPIAVAAALALAGCTSDPGTSTVSRTTSPPTLSSADFSACESLAGDTEAGNNVDVLVEDFAVPGRRMGTISPELKPFAMLVGSSAQLLQSGYDDGGLSGYVAQMRAHCVTEGWKPEADR